MASAAPLGAEAPPLLDVDRFSALQPELACVLGGLKPAGRHSVRADRAGAIVPELRRLGLAAQFFEPEDQAAGINYLGSAERTRLLAHRRGHILYSADPATCAALAAAHVRRDNEAIGALLGYPPCCIEANLIYDGLPYNDYVRVARVSEGFDWRLNVFIDSLRDGAGRLLQTVSHFPCSLQCRASIDQAARRLDLLDRELPALARSIRAAACMPLLLHDDSAREPAERTGLCGAALHGVLVASDLLFSGHVALRAGNRLPAALRSGGRLARKGSDLLLYPPRGTGRPQRLEGSQWLLMLPS